MSVRLLGITMARDEWPLLGVALLHHLRHLDTIVVLDHGSQDGTAEGLRMLADRHPGRLQIVRLERSSYAQEALTNLGVALGDDGTYDWIHVFDADEFLLTPPDADLRAPLDAVADDVDVVRYPVINWVAPADLDVLRADDHEQLRHRAIPTVFATMAPELAAHEVSVGNLNFFDLPFDSKVIVRGRRRSWIRAGAHLAFADTPLTELDLGPAGLAAAHLALPTRDRLALKARQGQDLIERGLPLSHGWQNQILHHLERAGQLDDFWAAHCIGSDTPTPRTLPTVTDDPRLGEAFRTIAADIGSLRSSETDGEDVSPTISTVSIDQLVTEVSSAIGALRGLERLLERSRQELAGMNARCVALDQQVADLSDALRRTEAQRDRRLLGADGRISRLTDLLERSQEEVVRLDEELSRATSASDEARRSGEMLTARVAILTDLLRQRDDELDQVRRQRALLDAELTAIRMSTSWRMASMLRRMRHPFR